MIDLPHKIAYILAILAIIQLFFVFFFNRKDIMHDLRGKDMMWQFLELSGIVWLVVFPVVVVVDILGVEIHSHTWTALELVYFMNLGAKASHKYIDQKFNKKENDINNPQ